MNLLVFHATSDNRVLTAMSEELALALSDLRHDVTLMGIPSEWESLAELISQRRIQHAISFSSFSAEARLADGRPLYDALGCGLVGWDVDHPAYQHDRFTAPVSRRVQVCASASHHRFSRFMGCEAVEAVTTPGVAAVAPDPLAIAERPLQAVIAMTWLGEPTNWWAQAKGTPAHDLVEGVVGRMLADEAVDLFDAYRQTLADTGMDLPFSAPLCSLLANAGRFIRQYDRMALATALPRFDVPIALCGQGWRERLGEHRHISFVDNLDYQALGEVYGQARVVVNLNAANGGSERAIAAMAAGAAVVSDFSPLLRSEFADQGAMRIFDRRRPEGLGEALGELLNGDGIQAMAERGRARVAQSHLWSHKAERLVAAMEAADNQAERRAA